MLRRTPCVDLQVCQGTQRAYALYDSTFQMVHPAQRNCLQQVDLAAQTVLRTAQEFSEEYELVCFAPGDGPDWGNELVAGAVHGSAWVMSRSCTFSWALLGVLTGRFDCHGLWMKDGGTACRLLHDVLQERAPQPVLPQVHGSDGRLLHLRPAQQHAHGTPAAHPELMSPAE